MSKLPMIMKHKDFSNNKHIDFISLRLANIIFTHGRSLNRVENAHFEVLADKETNKVVTVVCR